MHDDHRVIVPDLFGHGESDKPAGDYSLGAHAATMRDLLDRLGVERVTLVGHSLGGGIAMEFYYLFPERVERMVLVASGRLGREVNISAHDYLPDAAPIPTLIIWGSRDRMIPAWHAISSQRSIPGCRVELFEGAGHFLHLDEPDRFADLVRDFIATT